MKIEYFFDTQSMLIRSTGYVPMRHFTTEDEIIAELNEQGYAVSDIIKRDAYICTISKIGSRTKAQNLQKKLTLKPKGDK